MTLSTLYPDAFKLVLARLTVSDIGRMSCVCKEWNQALENQDIWQTLVYRVLNTFPEDFNTPWREWLKSPGVVKYPDGNEFDFKEGKIYINNGPSGFDVMLKRLSGPIIAIGIGVNETKVIRFRCKTEDAITTLNRLKDGEKWIPEKPAWDDLEKLEKDPSVRQWSIIWGKI